jgi:peptidoglycan/xylan/chitin deacetylase (PgdA/CDA1 family)
LNITQSQYAIAPLSYIPFDSSHLHYKNDRKAIHDGGENTTVTPVPNTENSIVFHGPRNEKNIALTFDADMTPGMKYFLQSGKVQSYYDNKLVKILKDSQTSATFFLSGMWIELYPQITRQLAADPLFELGNHSYSHPSFEGVCYGLPRITDMTMKNNEIEKTQYLLKTIAGVENKLFRFPGGCYGKVDLEIAQKDKVLPIQWDVVGSDGFNNDEHAIVSNVLNHVENGSIIIMHMNGYPNDPETSNALPIIISTLKEKGYQFVTVSALLQNTEFSNNATITNKISIL